MSARPPHCGLRMALTGAEGFLGRAVEDALLADGKSAATRLGNDVCGNLSLNEPVDVVGHFAGKVGDSFIGDPDLGFRVNVLGTLNVLALCRRLRARLVFASTCAVYRPFRGAVKESDSVGPISDYGFSKHLAELLCIAHAQYTGLPTLILRIFNPYGPGQRASFLVPYLWQTIRSGEVLRLKHPHSLRDFIYVDDLVQAVLSASVVERGLHIVNIGSGVPASVVDIVDMIAKVSGKNGVWEQAAGVEDDPFCGMWADISGAQSTLAWKPTTTLEAGLRMTLNGPRPSLKTTF